MSRARVDQIVNQQGTGGVEFPYGLEVNADQTLKIGGPVVLHGGSASTAANQIPKTEVTENWYGEHSLIFRLLLLILVVILVCKLVIPQDSFLHLKLNLLVVQM